MLVGVYVYGRNAFEARMFFSQMKPICYSFNCSTYVFQLHVKYKQAIRLVNRALTVNIFQFSLLMVRGIR